MCSLVAESLKDCTRISHVFQDLLTYAAWPLHLIEQPLQICHAEAAQQSNAQDVFDQMCKHLCFAPDAADAALRKGSNQAFLCDVREDDGKLAKVTSVQQEAITLDGGGHNEAPVPKALIPKAVIVIECSSGPDNPCTADIHLPSATVASLRSTYMRSMVSNFPKLRACGVCTGHPPSPRGRVFRSCTMMTVQAENLRRLSTCVTSVLRPNSKGQRTGPEWAGCGAKGEWKTLAGALHNAACHEQERSGPGRPKKSITALSQRTAKRLVSGAVRAIAQTGDVGDWLGDASDARKFAQLICSDYGLRHTAGTRETWGKKKPVLCEATFIATVPDALLEFQKVVAELSQLKSNEGRWSLVVKLSNIAKYYSYASMQEQLGVSKRSLQAARSHARQCASLPLYIVLTCFTKLALW